MTTGASVIEIVQYERWFFARCRTCSPARNVSPRDRKTEAAAVADAKEHALTHRSASTAELFVCDACITTEDTSRKEPAWSRHRCSRCGEWRYGSYVR